MADGKLLIICIHGLANKPGKKQLKEWREKSIKEGLRITCGNENPGFGWRSGPDRAARHMQ